MLRLAVAALVFIIASALGRTARSGCGALGRMLASSPSSQSSPGRAALSFGDGNMFVSGCADVI